MPPSTSNHRRGKAARPVTEGDAQRRILAFARQRFLSHGFRSVTMDELAHELGISKKTLYARFPSKAALLKAALMDKLSALQSDLAEIESACLADFSTYLHRLLACLHRHADEIKPPFVRDVQREAPELFELIRGKRKELIQRSFGKVFAQGRRQGLVRKDIAIPVMIEILLGAVDAVINPAKITELDLTPASGLSAILRVILEGIFTPRGRMKR